MKKIERDRSFDVIFDVSRLLRAPLWNTGISRYVREIAKRLSVSREVTVLLCYREQKNDFGLSGHLFNYVKRQLGKELVPLSDALERAKNGHRKCVFHSPVNPLNDVPTNAKIRRLITVHDVLHLTRSDLYGESNDFTKRIVRSIDPDKDMMICVSDFSKRDLGSLLGGDDIDVDVVPLGVAEAFKDPSPVKFERRFGKILCDNQVLVVPCQGDPRKGFRRMMTVAARWLKGGDSRIVSVFGRSGVERLVADAVESEGLNRGDDVIFFSDLTDEEMAGLYCKAVAQLYLSEAEGFGLPPLEAMSCGTPSLVLAKTALSDVYDGWQYLLNGDMSTDEMVRILEELTMNGKKWADASRAAKLFAGRYDWAETAMKHEDVYVKALMR